MRKHFDVGSLFVMFLTLACFVAALFLKGLGHDLLLEAGVFLVSVKLILMSYRNAIAADRLERQLNRILVLWQQGAPPATPVAPAGRDEARGPGVP